MSEATTKTIIEVSSEDVLEVEADIPDHQGDWWVTVKVDDGGTYLVIPAKEATRVSPGTVMLKGTVTPVTPAPTSITVSGVGLADPKNRWFRLWRNR